MKVVYIITQSDVKGIALPIWAFKYFFLINNLSKKLDNKFLVNNLFPTLLYRLYYTEFISHYTFYSY